MKYANATEALVLRIKSELLSQHPTANSNILKHTDYMKQNKFPVKSYNTVLAAEKGTASWKTYKKLADWLGIPVDETKKQLDLKK